MGPGGETSIPRVAWLRWKAWWLLPLSLWLTFQYRWVLDDAFVYFRYAENFRQTGQLVFNRDEYVEGFTSPLWMLFLTGTRLLGLPFWPVILAVSLASVIGLHAFLLRIHAALCPRSAPGAMGVPGALLLTNYAVLAHLGSGMETPLVQLCAVAFAYLVVRPSSRVAQLFTACAPVVRPELTLPFVVGVLWTWHRQRRLPVGLVATAALLGGGYLLFRVQYYRDLFPNTYYLKVGQSWARGLIYLDDTVGQYHLAAWLLSLLGATGWLVLRAHPGARVEERAVIWLGAGFVALHVVRLGGDFVHYRYLAFPLCAVLASFCGVVESVVPPGRIGGQVARWAAPALAAAFMTTQYPTRQLPAHPLVLGRHDDPTLGALTRYSARGIEDSMRHRSVQSLAPEWWDGGASRRRVPPRYGRLVYSAWCAAAYDELDSYFVHSLGLTEPMLARVQIAERGHAGHKWDLLPYARGLASIWACRDLPGAWGASPLRLAPGRGRYRAALARGCAPTWVEQRLRSLELLEAKAYGAASFRQSVELAFTRVSLAP